MIGPGKSWTEVLWIESESIPGIQDVNNLDAVLDYACSPTGYAGKRGAILGANYQIAEARAGFPLIGVRGVNRYIYQPGDQNHGSAQPEISVVTRCGDQTLQHRKYISLRGIWDAVGVTSTGTFSGDNGAAFTSAWNQYATFLVNGGWEWRGAFTSQRRIITDITPNLAEQQGITLDQPLTGVAVGSFYNVRVSGVNVKSRMNQQIIVQVQANGSLLTKFPYALFPYVLGGSVLYHTYTMYDIAQVRAMRLGSRDVGNSYKLSRGRRTPVPRG